MAVLPKVPRPLSWLLDPVAVMLLDLLERGDLWREIAYQEFTANTGIGATTEGTATTIVTAPAVECDGKPILIEFFCGRIVTGTNTLQLVLYDSVDGAAAASIGLIGQKLAAGEELGCNVSRRLVPAPGKHTFSIRGFVDAGITGNANASTGGAGKLVPGYIRITRA